MTITVNCNKNNTMGVSSTYQKALQFFLLGKPGVDNILTKSPATSDFTYGYSPLICHPVHGGLGKAQILGDFFQSHYSKASILLRYIRCHLIYSFQEMSNTK